MNTKETNIKLKPEEILFLKGNTGTVGIVKLSDKKMIFLGTPENDEIVQFLEPGDLIAVSAFGTGEKFENKERAVEKNWKVCYNRRKIIIRLGKFYENSCS